MARSQENTFEQWKANDLTDREAVVALCADYSEVQEVYDRASAMRDKLRDQLSQIVAHADAPIAVPNFGTLRLTAATLVAGWDGQALYSLAEQLNAAGLGGIADQIRACYAPKSRAGSLHIHPTRTKGV